MANRIFKENKIASTNKEVIFTSNEKQIVFLEIWNMTKDNIKLTTNDKEESIGDCGRITNDSHKFDKFELEEGEELTLFSEEENTIQYNIIK